MLFFLIKLVFIGFIITSYQWISCSITGYQYYPDESLMTKIMTPTAIIGSTFYSFWLISLQENVEKFYLTLFLVLIPSLLILALYYLSHYMFHFNYNTTREELENRRGIITMLLCSVFAIHYALVLMLY